MKKRKTRLWVGACMALSGGYLFASGNLSCGSFFTEAAISSVDMCFIFDCTSGAFGGLLDPCGTTGGTDTNSNNDPGGGIGFPGPNNGPFFSDCANVGGN